jgi:O-6-methylguanine DNA methyltransferase
MANRPSQPERSFAARVLAVVRRIPAGRVATYGDVATLAGAPGAARAVGTVMRQCGDGATPCHRVVGAGGDIGGWTGPMEFKRDRLRREGIQVNRTRIEEFSTRRWLPASATARTPARASRRQLESRTPNG